MSAPVGFVTAVLLFWGWRTGLWLFAGPMAALLEPSRLLKSKWSLREKDYFRLWDICMLLFVSGAIYLYNSDRTPASAFTFFQWFPIFLFPMALGQAYGTGENLSAKAFSWFYRRQPGPGRKVNITWMYLALCVVAASATNVRDAWFFGAVALLAGVALWSARPARFSLPAWAAAFALAVTFGFFTHERLHSLQNFMEQKTAEFFSRFVRREFDPEEARTALGRINSLKQSGRIVLRVKAVEGRAPALLRSASYTSFQEASWRVVHSDFVSVATESDTTTWNLMETNGAPNVVQIACYPSKGRALIPLPNGAAQILNAPVNGLETNRLGSTRVIEPPGLLNYRVRYASGRTMDARPDGADLEINPREQRAISDVIRELKLRQMSRDEALRAIARYFQQNYTYSLIVPQKRYSHREGLSPLSAFLVQTHAGHCEYFATATTLLLRKLGIPARYATGYSVQESNGRSYIVRERHAHAWCIYYADGAWHDFDTTPAGFSGIEEMHASLFEPVRDLFSNLWYYYSLWRWSGNKGWVSTTLGITALALVALLTWRLLLRGRATTIGNPGRRWQGSDSELFLVEKALARQKLLRHRHETFRQWFARLEKTLSPEHLAALEPVLALHYQYRFDPAALPPPKRTFLAQHGRAAARMLRHFRGTSPLN